MSKQSRRMVEWPQARCRVGMARCDVTPPVGMYHRAWGAAQHDRAEGIHRPLTATALYCSPEHDNPAGYACFVALDHCLLWTQEMRDLLTLAAETAGIDKNRLFVCFSHTHGAGLLGLDRQSEPGGELIAEYLHHLAVKIGQAVALAKQTAQPAMMVFGQGRCSLARHRDYFDSQLHQYVCGFNPEGTADDRVLVARVVDRCGSPFAVLVNYACHPTTLAWQNRLISPDYVGGLREVVEQETGVPCLFFQGASGDVGPREGFVGDPQVADRNGRQLGYAVLEALCDVPAAGVRFAYTGPVVSGATIGTWAYQPSTAEQTHRARTWRHTTVELSLPLRSDMPTQEFAAQQLEHWLREEALAKETGNHLRAAEARAQAERSRRLLTRLTHLGHSHTFPFTAHLWQIGESLWIALNGEYYNVLQRKLREHFPNYPIWVITLVNGSDVWYVPESDAYGKGIYQERTSILAEGSLETIVSKLTEAISELVAQRQPPSHI